MRVSTSPGSSSGAWWTTAFTALASTSPLPTVQPKLLGTFPHDQRSFTQGLHFEAKTGTLLESTGMYGWSTCRRVEIVSGMVIQQEMLANHHFGEGLSVVDDDSNTLVQLLWREGLCQTRDATTLQLRETLPLPTGMREGWGLTNDGQGALWASDGTATLFELDGASLEVTRRVEVHVPGLRRTVPRLNDLQWVDGRIWANVWGDDRLACIDPTSGEVRGWVDLSGLLTPEERDNLDYEEVLNGIAYDPNGAPGGGGCLYETGKNWPKLFQIELPRVE